MIKKFSFIIVIICFTFISSHYLFHASVEAYGAADSIKWAWRKNFRSGDIRNLTMAWNGSVMVFSITEPGAKKKGGDVIVGVDHGSKIVRDWRVSKKVNRLSLDGQGKQLLAELEGGTLLFYNDWTSPKKPVTINNSSSGSVLSPSGDLIVTTPSKAPGRSEMRVFSNKGKVLWSIPVSSIDDRQLIFPFLSSAMQTVAASPNSEVLSYNKDKIAWKSSFEGKPVNISSSFLEGGVVAVTSMNEKGRIRFFNDKGIVTGFGDYPDTPVSLSCSDMGKSCAVLARGDRGDDGVNLRVFSTSGRELWKTGVKTSVLGISSVVAASHGDVIIAGFEENGEWSLRAWDIKGKPLWIAPIEGGLLDFKVSWNGKRIAAITKDNRVVFFEMK